MESLESSKKRLKVFEQETATIVNRDQQFKQMMDQYLSRQGGDIQVIGAPPEANDQTESENIVEPSKSNEQEEGDLEEVDDDQSQVNSEYPASQDLIRDSEML